MNRTRQRHRPPRRRSGLSLIELMVVAVLLSVIGAMLTGLLVRQQRFHRTVTSVTDARAHMRDVSTILPTDMRSISTVGRDILSRGLTELQFRAFVGSSVLCNYGPVGNIIELPPKLLSSGNVLTSWINSPVPGDVVFLYNDSTLAGNVDDTWTEYTITDTATAVDAGWCPTSSKFTTAADNTQRRYRLTLNGTPNPARIKIGAPIRLAREVKYTLYQASDGQWYVGYQRCTNSGTPGVAGACGDREVLAGPVLPGTANKETSGLAFTYWKQNGSEAEAATDTVAWIDIRVRTASESMRRATATTLNNFAGGDSLRFIVGIRNRI